MGRGGVSPEYFLYRMPMWEAMLYLDGLQLRDRSIYDSMRILAANVLSGIGAKMKDGTAIQPSAIYQFPDEVEQEHIETEEEAQKKRDQLVELLRQCHNDNQHATK